MDNDEVRRLRERVAELEKVVVAMAGKIERLLMEAKRLSWTCPDCGAHASNQRRCGGWT